MMSSTTRVVDFGARAPLLRSTYGQQQQCLTLPYDVNVTMQPAGQGQIVRHFLVCTGEARTLEVTLTGTFQGAMAPPEVTHFEVEVAGTIQYVQIGTIPTTLYFNLPPGNHDMFLALRGAPAGSPTFRITGFIR